MSQDLNPTVSNATLKKMLDQVDFFIQKSIREGSINSLLVFGKELRAEAQVRGLALAKLLYEIQERWEEIGAACGIEDLWEDFIYATLGVATNTSRKYARMWGMIYGPGSPVPPTIQAKLRHLPVETHLLVAPSAGDFTQKQWSRLLTLPNKNAVRKLIREKSGGRTSSASALRLMLKKPVEGIAEIIAWKGKAAPVSIGFLKIKKDDLIAEAAIARIVSASGMVEE